MKSWRTTTCGICAILIAVATALRALLDGDPATNPDWATIIPLISLGGLGVFARDNKVTSEQAGAGK